MKKEFQKLLRKLRKKKNLDNNAFIDGYNRGIEEAKKIFKEFIHKIL